MKRVFWFGLGVGLTVVVVWKARQAYEKATPKSLQRTLVQTKDKATNRVTSFFEEVAQGMAEREAELRDAAGMEPASASRAGAPHRVRP